MISLDGCSNLSHWKGERRRSRPDIRTRTFNLSLIFFILTATVRPGKQEVGQCTRIGCGPVGTPITYLFIRIICPWNVSLTTLWAQGQPSVADGEAGIVVPTRSRRSLVAPWWFRLGLVAC